MPSTEVFFYQDENGHALVVEWLTELRRLDRKGYAKCVSRIRRLAELGHELRRPEADYLRDSIHELRARRGRVNYRILYFFHGPNVAVLAHALTKEGEIPDSDIERASGENRPLSGIQQSILTREKTPVAKTRDALKIIYGITGDDPELKAIIEEETIHAQVARMIYEARARAGLTQQQLADLVGTQQSVIARLEDADYEGHSLTMLQRIAAALHQRLVIHLVPAGERVS